MRYPNIDIIVKPNYKATITDVCNEIKMLSEHLRKEISFTFNGVELTTNNCSIHDMIQKYSIQHT